MLGDRAAGSSAVEKAVAATQQVLLQGVKEGDEEGDGGVNVKPLETDAGG